LDVYHLKESRDKLLLEFGL